MKEKGVALFLVLATIMIVVILGNIVLHIISSQSRLTHHQVSRIQAYYANLAGMNFALEQLRTGAWEVGTNCRPLPPDGRPDPLCNLNDPDLPRSIQQPITIIILPNPYNRYQLSCPPPNSNIPPDCACILVNANYTYSQ